MPKAPITVNPDSSLAIRAGGRDIIMGGPNDDGVAEELAGDLREEGFTVTIVHPLNEESF